MFGFFPLCVFLLGLLTKKALGIKIEKIQIVLFVEYLQKALITLNFILHLHWNLVLIPYIVYYFILLFIYFLLFLTIALLLFIVIKNLYFNLKLESLLIYFAIVGLSLFTNVLYFMYEVFNLMRDALTEKLFMNPKSYDLLERFSDLDFSCIYQIVANSVFLLLLLLLFSLIIRKINISQHENSLLMKILTYAEKIPLNLQPVNPDYFRRDGSGDVNFDPENFQQKECIICSENDKSILLRPCGHRVICQKCFNKYIKGNHKCLLCKQAVEKAYLTEWDPEKRIWAVRKVYMIKKNTN